MIAKAKSKRGRRSVAKTSVDVFLVVTGNGKVVHTDHVTLQRSEAERFCKGYNRSMADSKFSARVQSVTVDLRPESTRPIAGWAAVIDGEIHKIDVERGEVQRFADDYNAIVSSQFGALPRAKIRRWRGMFSKGGGR